MNRRLDASAGITMGAVFPSSATIECSRIVARDERGCVGSSPPLSRLERLLGKPPTAGRADSRLRPSTDDLARARPFVAIARRLPGGGFRAIPSRPPHERRRDFILTGHVTGQASCGGRSDGSTECLPLGDPAPIGSAGPSPRGTTRWRGASPCPRSEGNGCSTGPGGLVAAVLPSAAQWKRLPARFPYGENGPP